MPPKNPIQLRKTLSVLNEIIIRTSEMLSRSPCSEKHLVDVNWEAQRFIYRLFFISHLQHRLNLDWMHGLGSWSDWLDLFRQLSLGGVHHAPLLGELWETDDDELLRVLPVKPDDLSELFSDLHPRDWYRCPLKLIGSIHETWLSTQRIDGPVKTHQRRKSGSYYTDSSLAKKLLTVSIETYDFTDSKPIRICDPACGAGAFLTECVELLYDSTTTKEKGAWISDSIFGVDIHLMTVNLCRMNLWFLADDPHYEMTQLCSNIRWGNALLCSPFDGRTLDIPKRTAPSTWRSDIPMDWTASFPSVFFNNKGFDLVVGNPPWIAHAGRAAQSIPKDIHSFFKLRYQSFHAYRTTHSMFAELCAEICTPGGRIALIVPTSMADLRGYRYARSAFSRYARPIEPLFNVGDGAFDGVFQPCMFLLAERHPEEEGTEDEWVLSRDDLCRAGGLLLKKLKGASNFPKKLFGERGIQSHSAMREKLQRQRTPTHFLGLMTGSDIRPFKVKPASCWANPKEIQSSLRSKEVYLSVDIWIRQTARFPIAAPSNGDYFRNSILAAFATEEWNKALLLGLLNSSVLRWFHYHCFRDAREGMPQIKINHLRQYPKPVPSEYLANIQNISQSFMSENREPTPKEFKQLHELSCQCYGLSESEKSLVWEWVKAQ